MKAVLQGEDIVVAVEGGFRRKPAPTDGIETATGEWIPLAELQRAFCDLKERQEKRPAARWTRRRR